MTESANTAKEGASDMPTSSSPSGSGGAGYRRHFRYGAGDLRASDAERADVADRLSKHYQDGRLDQAEFNERLDKAMNAKTRADFNGLFYDLPDLPDPADQAGPGGQRGPASGPAFSPGRVQRRQAHRGGLSYLAFLCFVVVGTIIVAHSLMHFFFFVPWLLIGGLAFLWLRYEHNRRG